MFDVQTLVSVWLALNLVLLAALGGLAYFRRRESVWLPERIAREQARVLKRDAQTLKHG